MTFFIASPVVDDSKADPYSIATLAREGKGPPVVWLGGFRSDMRATKAEALDHYCKEHGHAFIRFDYSGHGESGGKFENGTIGQWLSDALTVITACAKEPPVLVGSSMGGWIALLAAIGLQKKKSALAPCGLVLIAPAVDFTENLMWAQFSNDIRTSIMENGQYALPSAYAPEPTIITRGLIMEGRNHLLLGKPIAVNGPVHILQGRRDPDVPWHHALEIVEHMPSSNVTLTMIHDGDHRLSRPQDIEVLLRAMKGMLKTNAD
jgi:pimeloyl-ACP methyl ester carboxylesterase